MPGVPFDHSAIGRYASRADWESSAPSLLAERLAAWRVSPVAGLHGGVAGMVLAVETAGGTPAVLKIGYPHDEARWEPVALSAFGSALAPRIFEEDPDSWSLLLEQVNPGTQLARAEIPTQAALRIGGGLHAEIASRNVPDGLPTLRSLVGEYLRSAGAETGRQGAELRALGVADTVSDALGLLERLAADDVPAALVHGDYNPGNILDSGAGRWRVIDPKPVVGDPCFDLWPLATQLSASQDSPTSATQLGARLEVAAEAAAVDSERSGLWAFARAALSLIWRLAESDQGEPDKAGTRLEARLLSAWAEVARS
ncbi:MAG TPA: aminoglycoside phosphotransferase family protein [Galbitalea sp.]|jgi:streptomycin 6-kinase